MNAYSKDLRLKVLSAVDRGLPKKEISELFEVSRSTLKRWLHCEAFEDEAGVGVSEATMSRSIKRLPGEWPLKKVPGSPRTRRGALGLVEVAGLPL